MTFEDALRQVENQIARKTKDADLRQVIRIRLWRAHQRWDGVRPWPRLAYAIISQSVQAHRVDTLRARRRWSYVDDVTLAHERTPDVEYDAQRLTQALASLPESVIDLFDRGRGGDRRARYVARARAKKYLVVLVKEWKTYDYPRHTLSYFGAAGTGPCEKGSGDK